MQIFTSLHSDATVQDVQMTTEKVVSPSSLSCLSSTAGIHFYRIMRFSYSCRPRFQEFENFNKSLHQVPISVPRVPNPNRIQIYPAASVEAHQSPNEYGTLMRFYALNLSLWTGFANGNIITVGSWNMLRDGKQQCWGTGRDWLLAHTEERMLGCRVAVVRGTEKTEIT